MRKLCALVTAAVLLGAMRAETGAGDGQPLGQPTDFVPTTATQTTFGTQWTAVTDDLGVDHYQLFLDGLVAGTTTATSYTFTGLQCGRGYTFGVEAVDAAGNASSRATGGGKTEPCGSVLYRHSWDAGGFDAGWTHQCHDNIPSPQRGTAAAVQTDPGSGTAAGQFDLPQYNGKTACEVLHDRTAAPETDDYYALAVKVPVGWQKPSTEFWDVTIAQFNYQAIWGGALELEAHSDRIDVAYQAGACVAVRGCEYDNGAGELPGHNTDCSPSCRIVPSGQLTQGTWMQMVVHVHWTSSPNGVVEGWYKHKGDEAWTKTVSITGRPTLQTGTDFRGTTWSADDLAREPTSDKFGAYRGASTAPMRIYHDDWCRATTLEEAAACLG
jgi:hypothetical protein